MPPSFLVQESGAVTVDWVVMAAAVVGLGVASVGAVRTGTTALGGDIETSLTAAGVASLGRFNPLERRNGFADGLGGLTAITGTAANMLRHMTGAGSDGQPGYLQFYDMVGDTTWVSMGSDFAGDQSDKYGGTLSFDIRVDWTQTGEWVSPTHRMVEIVGANGVSLTWAAGTNPPIGSWSTISAPITAGSMLLSNGQPATEAQIRSVLANVQSTNLRTEFFSNGEQISFDNIRFQ